ncbi:MAG: hypothetical protein C4529_14825 [Deltaproteobacteria bacterium]|nr:MAG: hypothetical protein C4529_14825 [Deltaproteobacteria bacterium]
MDQGLPLPADRTLDAAHFPLDQLFTERFLLRGRRAGLLDRVVKKVHLPFQLLDPFLQVPAAFRVIPLDPDLVRPGQAGRAPREDQENPEDPP